MIYRNQFPDLQWLKQRIRLHFDNNQFMGWPNVIIHAKTRQEHRPDIKGTLSLFTNLAGNSYCETDQYRVKVNSNVFFISNLDQHYSLYIDSEVPVETFNIHFAQTLVEDVFRNKTDSSSRLLDQPFSNLTEQVTFYNKLYEKDLKAQALLNALLQSEQDTGNSVHVEELLAKLIMHLLGVHSGVMKQVDSLPSVRSVTKKEIYKRLHMAKDYIHAYAFDDISLDDLAGISCMSKFHFLRMFHAVFHHSPYQYILKIRMQKAVELLTQSVLSTNEISSFVGFENTTSFCRAFYKTYQQWPKEYRLSADAII